MRYKKHGILAAIIGLGLLLTGAAPASAESRFVSDEAGVITDIHREQMEENAALLRSDTGVEAVVVTLPSREGEDPAHIVTSLVEEWALGGTLRDSYVVLLYSEQDGAAWVATGSRLRSDLTVEWLGEVADGIIQPLLESGEVSRALSEGHRALVVGVYEAFGTTPGNPVGTEGRTVRSQREQQTMKMIVVAGCMLIILRGFWVTNKSRKRYQKLWPNGYVGRKRSARSFEDREEAHLMRQDIREIDEPESTDNRKQ